MGKYICLVENIEELPEITPVITGDINGNIAWRRYEKPASKPNIKYTTSSGEKIENEFTLTAITHEHGTEENEWILTFNELTNIPEYAFSDCSDLTSVTIPNSVISIGNGAFSGCSGLPSVTIPNSVTRIGYYAFQTGSSVAVEIDITFVSTNPISLVDSDGTIITIFGEGEYASIPTIHVPVGYEEKYAMYDDGWVALAKYIDGYEPAIKTDSIFTYDDSTTSTSSDETISQSSYDGSKTLISVEIGTKATSIEEYAFDGCDSLTSIEIPNSVVSIGYGAFWNCADLPSVTIPNSVTSIGDNAFYNCISLNSITIPNSVTSIGNYAFAEGWSYPILKSITFESTIPIDLVKQDDSVINLFGNPDYLVDFAIHVPSGYEETYATHDAGWEILAPFIVGYAPVIKTDTIFTYYDGTTSTSSDQTISQSSYVNKTLISVEIGTKATSIGYEAFIDCHDLASVTIPNSVTSIGDDAFFSCESMTSITIPNSVTSIGNYAFYNTNITATFVSPIPNISLEINDEIITPFGGDVDSEPAVFTIIVPAGCKAAYVAKDSGWEALAAYIEEA